MPTQAETEAERRAAEATLAELRRLLDDDDREWLTPDELDELLAERERTGRCD